MIRKVLLVPGDKLLDRPARPATGSMPSRVRAFINELRRGKRLIYNQELLYHADLPTVLGPDNVYVWGKLRSHFYDPKVPANCSYPSFHGSPRGRMIQDGELETVIREVDVAIISILAGERLDQAVRIARKHGVPVALLDTPNQETNYGATDVTQNLTYRFQRGRDFDVYLKDDLPLGYRSDVILPLAPCPVRPSSYSFARRNKDISIFYSGRPRDEKNQADRAETVAIVKDAFPDACVLEHVTSKTFLSPSEYQDRVARSRMALCPSGRIWDSWRYAETGLAPGTAVIAPTPYVETVGPALQDGLNSVLYDVEFREGRYHVARPEEFRESLIARLADPDGLERLAATWARDVLAGHTTTARARDVVELIQSALGAPSAQRAGV